VARSRDAGYVSAYEVDAVYVPNPLTVDYLVIGGGGGSGGNNGGGRWRVAVISQVLMKSIYQQITR
jgi:hypothetical protein